MRTHTHVVRERERELRNYLNKRDGDDEHDDDHFTSVGHFIFKVEDEVWRDVEAQRHRVDLVGLPKLDIMQLSNNS